MVGVYRVLVTPAADKARKKIPDQHLCRIDRVIDGLARNPRPRGCKKIDKKQQLYRIRVGEYRIIYTVNGGRLIVIIVKISDRKDVYRKR